MNDVQYGNRDYSSVKAIGDKLMIRKLVRDDLRLIGGIFVPESTKNLNMRIGVGQILELGDGAKEKYALKEGDFVLYDYYSANGDWRDIIITDGENVILQLTEQEAKEYSDGTLHV